MTLAQETYQWSLLQTDTIRLASTSAGWFSGYVGVTDPIDCYLILDVKPRNGTNRFPNNHNGAASNQQQSTGHTLKRMGDLMKRKSPATSDVCQPPDYSSSSPPECVSRFPVHDRRAVVIPVFVHCGRHTTYPSFKAQQLKQIGEIPKGILMTAASSGTDAGTRLRSFFACTT